MTDPSKPTRAELLRALNACAQPGLHRPDSEAWLAACEAQKLVYRECGADWHTSPYIDQDSLAFDEEEVR